MSNKLWHVVFTKGRTHDVSLEYFRRPAIAAAVVAAARGLGHGRSGSRGGGRRGGCSRVRGLAAEKIS